MNIIVCIKRVAATDSKIAIGADGLEIDPQGVEFVLNPYDEIAMEEGIKTKETQGDGSVTVVTLGTADSVKELRTCLAMGADQAVLLKSEGASLDSYATAEILANYIKSVPHDLVLFGKQAVDGDDGQVPQRVASLLDVACVTDVKGLELKDGVYTAERDIEGGRERVRCPLPAVISTNKGLNEPRYASLKGIMSAKRKPLEEVDISAVAPATAASSLSLPPARPDGKILGEGAAAVGALIDVLKNEAKVL